MKSRTKKIFQVKLPRRNPTKFVDDAIKRMGIFEAHAMLSQSMREVDNIEKNITSLPDHFDPIEVIKDRGFWKTAYGYINNKFEK